MRRNNTTRKIIAYAAANGAKSCMCNTDDENKVKKDATNPTSANISNAQRIATNIWTNANGCSRLNGTPQFGGAAYGQVVVVNAFGRVAGQPGGSGRPPRNQFV